MIERAELRVQRNSTLNAGGHAGALLGQGGSRRAMSPHSSGRPPQQVSVRNDSSCPQRDEADGVDDLAALPGGLRQPGTLQRGEMEGCG